MKYLSGLDLSMRDLAKESASQKKREILWSVFLGHFSFWVSGVELSLIFFYTKNKKIYIYTNT